MEFEDSRIAGSFSIEFGVFLVFVRTSFPPLERPKRRFDILRKPSSRPVVTDAYGTKKRSGRGRRFTVGPRRDLLVMQTKPPLFFWIFSLGGACKQFREKEAVLLWSKSSWVSRIKLSGYLFVNKKEHGHIYYGCG